MEVPQGRFELTRHPTRPRLPLRAWDAADEYVLEHIAATATVTRSHLALVNDSFGALATALHSMEPQVVSDSHNARIALERNAAANGIRVAPVSSSLDSWPAALELVVIKVPPSNGQLEDQLHRLRPSLGPRSLVVGAGMAKHVHRSTIGLFETILGPTTTTRARKKARLLLCDVDPGLSPPQNPWPVTWSHGGLPIVSHGGVFSARRLDSGTGMLLGNLPATEPGARILDLGCGNGVVGLCAAHGNESSSLTFADESYRALASARATWAASAQGRTAKFVTVDRAVNALDRGELDVVLANPPFHADRSLGDAVAWDMFVDSHTLLREGGELRVVGNRHLAHHAKLKKIFGNCAVVAADDKYVVLSAHS